MNDKKLWNKLAKKNYRFYIYNNLGKDISEGDFILSGEEDYQKYVSEDKIIQERFPKRDGLTALEIGCGAGRILRPMARDFGHVIGTDVSEEMLKQARPRVDAELLETDGATIPVEDSSVDFAFSFLVFQHMKDYDLVEKNFKEVYRVLKPNGIFKVLMRGEKQKSTKPWWSGVHFSLDDIFSLYTKIGFKFIKYEPFPRGRFWIWLEK